MHGRHRHRRARGRVKRPFRRVLAVERIPPRRPEIVGIEQHRLRIGIEPIQNVFDLALGLAPHPLVHVGEFNVLKNFGCEFVLEQRRVIRGHIAPLPQHQCIRHRDLGRWRKLGWRDELAALWPCRERTAAGRRPRHFADAAVEVQSLRACGRCFAPTRSR